jgi:hypothetical protein
MSDNYYDDYYFERPIGVVTHEMAIDAGDRELEGQLIWPDNSSRTDAELHGEPYPRDAQEAAQRVPVELLRRET